MMVGILLGLAVLCLLVYQPFMDFLKNPDILYKQFLQLGFIGQLIFIAVMALQVVLIFLPGEIVEIGAGYMYGPINGMLLCMAGSIIGTIIIYFCIEKIGGRYFKQKVDQKQLQKLTKMQSKKNIHMITFLVFLIPGTPKDLLTYVAPFTGIRLKSFLWITSIARIPSIVSSTIGGSSLHNDNWMVSIAIFVGVAVLSILGLYYYKWRM